MTWLTALRDHPQRPPVAQRMALHALALRMDWQTGTGYASTAQLAADADCGERTVRGATGWARAAAMLVQTRRGHRVTAERVTASEWRLTLPDESQPDTAVRLGPEPTGSGLPGGPRLTGHRQELPVDIPAPTGTAVPVGADPTGTAGRPNRHGGETQPARGAPPSRPVVHLDLSPSARAPASGADESETGDEEEDEPDPAVALLAAAVPDADPRDVDWAVTSLREREYRGEIRSVRAYLRAVTDRGDARVLVDEAAAEQRRPGHVIGADVTGTVASSCQSRDHTLCVWSWCACRCHRQAVRP
jgi:hypothetical protein